MDVSWDQALAWRMRRHLLVERARAGDLAAVVDRLRGLHAQVMSSVDLALWARVEGLGPDDVAEALWRKRTLVKTWAMRATLHVLPAAELGTFIAGFGIWKVGTWPLKEPRAIPVVGLMDRALRGKLLTRRQLAAAVTGLGATPAMVKGMLGSWGGYLQTASLLGSLCFAPPDGAEARFTHPATWLRRSLKGGDRAFDVLTTRFLGTHGPATAHDLAWWWGINRGEAKRRLAAVAGATTEITVEGERRWMLASDVAELAATKPVEAVRLLPAFDQWVMCASRSPALLAAAHRPRIYRQQGWVSPVLLVDGRMAGTWKHERRGAILSVEIEAFAKLPPRARAQAAAEAERLAAFLGGEPKLTIRA